MNGKPMFGRVVATCVSASRIQRPVGRRSIQYGALAYLLLGPDVRLVGLLPREHVCQYLTCTLTKNLSLVRH